MKTPSTERVSVSKRLKAARQLAGYVDHKGVVQPLPIRDLIELPELKANEISKNRIEEIEQLKVDARPGELQHIERALGLPENWFGRSLNRSLGDLLLGVVRDVRARRPRPGELPGGSDEENRPPGGGGGAGG